tara:strand:- start:598 stop:792 length:195 start_codon:yes stop_codon:yes gene_type:complete
MSKDRIFKVTFAPSESLIYTYEVEVNDPNNAEAVALEEFRMDIGYDRSKDFEIIACEEEREPPL